MIEVFAALDALGAAWYLTGSEALAAYATPRQTMDTDVVVDATPDRLDELGTALAGRFLFAEPIRTGTRWMASLIDRAGLGKVDLIVRDPDAWGPVALARRRRWTHPGWGPVWVSTLEDLLLAKLEWSDGISELQLRDRAGLLRMNRDMLDEAYLGRWATTLGVLDRLEAARRAS